MTLKPLGIVKDIVESIGVELTYAYDDLVFVNHNAFIIQFAKDNSKLIVHINKDANESDVLQSISLMSNEAASRDIAVIKGKYYTLVQADDENVRIEFIDSKD